MYPWWKYPEGKSDLSGNVYTPTGHKKVHDKGHLIANSLGGSDLEQANIVPLFYCTNHELMAPIERQVQTSVRDGETIYYRVSAIYEDAGPIPVAIRTVALGDKGTKIVEPWLPNNKDCQT